MSSASKLRVALFVASRWQPQWRYRAIELVASSQFAQIVAVVDLDGLSHERPGAGTLGQGLFRAHEALDRRLFATDPDPLAPVNISPLVKGAAELRLDAARDSASHIAAVASLNIDVALWFAASQPSAALAALPRYGTWQLFFGNRAATDERLAGFDEVMNAEPVTTSGIKTFATEMQPERVVYQSSARTLSYSFRMNQENILRKTSEFAARRLRDLYLDGALTSDAAWQSGTGDSRAGQLPRNAEMVRRLLRFVPRLAARMAKKLGYVDQWVLAYRHARAAKFTVLLPGKDRLWADPFPVTHEGRQFVFFEEYVFATHRAHIAVAEIDEGGLRSVPQIALELPYHLSYPFMFEWRGVHYMIPESGANMTVDLYRCERFPTKWALDRTLISGIRAADATLHEHEGRWWLFANVSPFRVEIYDELHLYYADTPFGPWHAHARNPIVSDVLRARPAGRLFRRGDKLLRPAQICAPLYGSGICVNRILRMTPDEYVEEPDEVLMPQFAGEPRFIGMHTLNCSGELTMIDGFMRRPRFF